MSTGILSRPGRGDASPAAERRSVAEQLRVVVVDDHQLFLDGLGHVLAGEPDLEVVAVALSLAEGERVLVTSRPDVVVLDRRLPDGDALTRLARIARLVPDARLVVLSSEYSPAAHAQALATGASAYLCKTAGLGEVLDAVRGRQPRSTTPAGTARPRRPLTEREAVVLQLMADGLTNPAIAERLGLSLSTVRSHVSRLGAKMGARSKLETVSRARRAGLVC